MVVQQSSWRDHGAQVAAQRPELGASDVSLFASMVPDLVAVAADAAGALPRTSSCTVGGGGS